MHEAIVLTTSGSMILALANYEAARRQHPCVGSTHMLWALAVGEPALLGTLGLNTPCLQQSLDAGLRTFVEDGHLGASSDRGSDAAAKPAPLLGERAISAFMKISGALGLQATQQGTEAFAHRVQLYQAALTTPKLPSTPGFDDVLHYAQEEARAMGLNYCTPRHLILGLLREPREDAGALLRGVCPSLEEARRALAHPPSEISDTLARCDLCGRPATVHVIQTTAGTPTPGLVSERHLCESCARREGLPGMQDQQM